MTRALAALALSAGLAVAGAAAAQGYQQGYPTQQGYPNQQGYPGQQGPNQPYGQQGYDRQGYGQPPVYQRPTESTPTYPDRADGDRRYQDDPRSIDPAPGARGPYVGAGRGRFYNIEDRIGRVESRLAGLPASQRRRAYVEMRSIRAEESTQRSRHGGDLRDWDRERLTRRLDALVARYPGLGR